MRNLKASWRQLPFIVIGGLLIGIVFGEVLKAFAGAPATAIAQDKPRP